MPAADPPPPDRTVTERSVTARSVTARTVPGRTPAERSPLARLAPWLAIAAAVLGLLWEPLAHGKALAPYASLANFEPWASETDLEPRNPLLLDQPLVTLPWLAFFAAELHGGEVPLWNPHNALGQPVHAALTGGLLWPGHWPFLAWPDWRVLAWTTALELVLAGGLFHLVLRRFGLRPWATTVGGIGYALCGFQVVWLGHPHVHAALVLPLALIAVERCIEARGGVGARDGRRGVALVALSVALLGVCGHAQTAFHVALWTAGWALVRTRVGPRPRAGGRALGRLALGAALGGLLAAPQVLPFAEYLGQSRAAEALAATDLVTEVAPWKAAVMLVDPGFFGDPLAGTYAGPVGHNLNYTELAGGFVGRVLLALALLGAALVLRRRAPDARFALALVAVVVGACFAWQVPAVYDAARAVPVLGSTKLMRFALLLAAGLVALGALGLDRVLARIPAGRARHLVGALVALVVATELAVQHRGFNPSIEPTRLFEHTTTSAIVSHLDGRTLGTEGTTFAPNANAPLGVSLVHGYDSIEVERVTDLVTRLTTAELEFPFASTIPFFDRALPLVRALGVEQVVTRSPLPAPYTELVTAPGGLSVWSDPAPLGRVWVARATEVVEDDAERLARLEALDFDPLVALVEEPPPAGATDRAAPAGTAELAIDEPRHLVIEVELDAPSLVVVADAWYPGWRATVDGEARPIERVDHALRGVWLEAGSHRLELRYAPRSWSLGLLLAGLGGLGLVGLVLLPGRGRGGASGDANGDAGVSESGRARPA